jgi:hypothetical protein
LSKPVDANGGELAGASEGGLLAEVTGAVPAALEVGTTVADAVVEVGQLGVVVEVVVDVGVVVEVVDVGVDVEVVDVEVVVEVVDVEVVDVGVVVEVVEVVDVEVVVEVGQLGTVVEVVVVEDVVVGSVVAVGSVVVVAAGSAVDDSLEPLPPAAGASTTMAAPTKASESSALTLHLRNLKEPTPSATRKVFYPLMNDTKPIRR